MLGERNDYGMPIPSTVQATTIPRLATTATFVYQFLPLHQPSGAQSDSLRSASSLARLFTLSDELNPPS